MEIKPLICPQCGGEIKAYSPAATSAECTYCGTNFLIDKKDRQPPAFHYESFELPESGAKPGAIIALLLIGIVGAIFLVAMYNNVKTPPAFVPTAAKSLTPKPAVPAFPKETPIPNLLEFGGKGTGDGLFQDATSVAVDKRGRIYVS